MFVTFCNDGADQVNKIFKFRVQTFDNYLIFHEATANMEQSLLQRMFCQRNEFHFLRILRKINIQNSYEHNIFIKNSTPFINDIKSINEPDHPCTFLIGSENF